MGSTGLTAALRAGEGHEGVSSLRGDRLRSPALAVTGRPRQTAPALAGPRGNPADRAEKIVTALCDFG